MDSVSRSLICGDVSVKITVIGSGYVGLVTGACFADMGNHVTCVDVDQSKLTRLRAGEIPIYEPGLEGIVHQAQKMGFMTFTDNLQEALKGCDVAFIAVGTPPNEDGSADLKYVLGVAKQIGEVMEDYLVVVDKSTVPVGIADKVSAQIKASLEARGADLDFDVVSNPEFLKEGAAINDFMKPDRIVIGTDSEKAEVVMRELYAPFSRNHDKMIVMGVRDAEMTKYAANAMLATKISFMNDVANLCEIMGADVNLVRRGIGSDPRIGNKFIYPGIGYGGSCFPKDVKALVRTARENGYEMRILQSVEDVNEDQKSVLFNKVMKRFNGDLKGKHFAVWGLSFKPNTDDMREAPSVVIIDKLLAKGATVSAYDPVAMEEAKRDLGDRITYAKDEYEAIKDADALLVVTEWSEFRVPDFEDIKAALKNPLVFDGRNIFEIQRMAELGFEYHCIGVKS